MPALSNDPARCELMNLGWGPQGHGPYLVRQEGYVPAGMDFTPRRFILMKDGSWLLNLAFVMLPENEQEAQLFHSLNEALEFLDLRAADTVVAEAGLPPGASPPDIMRHFEECTRRILRGMRTCTVHPVAAIS